MMGKRLYTGSNVDLLHEYVKILLTKIILGG